VFERCFSCTLYMSSFSTHVESADNWDHFSLNYNLHFCRVTNGESRVDTCVSIAAGTSLQPSQYMCLLKYAPVLVQFSSSSPLGQCATPSHLRYWGMHVPFMHSNSLNRQAALNNNTHAHKSVGYDDDRWVYLHLVVVTN